jgi:hypothetical protein
VKDKKWHLHMGCTSLLSVLIFQACVVTAIVNFAPGLIDNKKEVEDKPKIEEIEQAIQKDR